MNGEIASYYEPLAVSSESTGILAATSVSKVPLQARITVTLNAGSATYVAKYRAAEEFAQIARETVSAFHAQHQ